MSLGFSQITDVFQEVLTLVSIKKRGHFLFFKKVFRPYGTAFSIEALCSTGICSALLWPNRVPMNSTKTLDMENILQLEISYS